MPELAPKAELMRSLGRLVRGLSALFWGLPFALLACAQTEIYHWFQPYGAMLPSLAHGLILYGLVQLNHFQRQERIWRTALERTQILAVANLGLSPFLFFWNKMPRDYFFIACVALLAFSCVLFLFNFNHLLHRLSAMLPDETLREETRIFTRLNQQLLLCVMGLIVFYVALLQFSDLPTIILQILAILDWGRHWLLIFLILLPSAMTMTLTWKIKEAIMDAVFSQAE